MNIKYISLLGICLLSALLPTLPLSCPAAEAPSEPSLKNAVGDRFLVGVALNTRQVNGNDTNATVLIKRHFNSIVAENCMKSAPIHPQEDRYHFEEADQFVRFGEENHLAVIGHCLIWHSQLPRWFWQDEKGEKVSPEVLREHMKAHISTVVGRYKGRVKGWDVVNEAIEWNGSWRKSPFYEILGEEFIPLAFQYAHEADPEAELYYNDYGMDGVAKRKKVVELIQTLKKNNLRIDAVGMQSHIGMDYPSLQSFEDSIRAFSSAGVKVIVSEWDMSALPAVHRESDISATRTDASGKLNPYPQGLPEEVSNKWNQRMEDFFALFLKHSEVISRVTVWGLTDAYSWKNNYPIRGRVDYPLLFDRQYKPKAFVKKFIESTPPVEAKK